MTLASGTRLGSYEVVDLLGAGGMGEVYRARDTRLKRDVALKILSASFASDPERLARFQREAEVLARVPVWRPIGQGAFVRWQFGIARCRYTDGGPDSIGLFECTDVFTLPAGAANPEVAGGSGEGEET